MAVIFFFVITPINFVMKIFQKDLIGLKKNNRDSYWIDRDKNNKNMRNQF